MGLIVMAAIFAFGVVLFALLAIALIPGALLLQERLDAVRARRAEPRPDE